MEFSAPSDTRMRHLAQKLEAAGWGAFFVWVGVSLLANLGWGVGLLGVGIITLVGQVARGRCGLGSEGFWIFVGFVFVLGGLWELFEVQFDLVPIVLVVAGLSLLLSAARR